MANHSNYLSANMDAQVIPTNMFKMCQKPYFVQKSNNILKSIRNKSREVKKVDFPREFF